MATSLSIMTFNVRGTRDDRFNTWPERSALNVRVIQQNRPDLMGLQEAQSGNLDTYAQELTDYACEPGPLSIRQTETYERLPIYWLAERFECRANGGFYLSETPDVWSLGWGANLVRAVNWVKLRCRQTGLEFIYLNTHLDHESERARVNSARLILNRLPVIREERLPVIITADFNTAPNSPVYQTFLAGGCRDTYTEAGHTDTADVNTFHDFQGESYAQEKMRMDWILFQDGADRRFTVKACDILLDAEPPVYPSDHYPVVARLESD